MTRPASSAQHAAAVSRRAHISSGTIPPPPTRRAFQVSTQPLQSRSRTGTLPLRSREPNAPHLPEVTTYPHPEEEDPEEIPQATATAAAEDAEFDHEDSVILHPTDQGGAERTCRTTQGAPSRECYAFGASTRGARPTTSSRTPRDPDRHCASRRRLRASGEARPSGAEARLTDLLERNIALEAAEIPRRQQADEEGQKTTAGG